MSVTANKCCRHDESRNLIYRDRFVIEDNPNELGGIPFRTYFVTDYMGDQRETREHEKILEEQLIKDLELMGQELELVDEHEHDDANASCTTATTNETSPCDNAANNNVDEHTIAQQTIVNNNSVAHNDDDERQRLRQQEASDTAHKLVAEATNSSQQILREHLSSRTSNEFYVSRCSIPGSSSSSAATSSTTCKHRTKFAFSDSHSPIEVVTPLAGEKASQNEHDSSDQLACMRRLVLMDVEGE